MLLPVATSAFKFGRRRYISAQHCYLHCFSTSL